MSRIEVPDYSFLDDVKDAKEPTEEEKARYKKLVEEANERIREAKRQEAEAWIHAQSYVAL